jgi:hypothetical protein
MIEEILSLYSVKFAESALCKTPEALNTIHMLFASYKLVLSMKYPVVFLVAHIN